MSNNTPKIVFYHGNCLDVVNMIGDNSIDCILTSPPYGGKVHTNPRRSKTYDEYADEIDIPKYNEMCVNLFNHFGRILKKDGVVLWNVSYNKYCSEQFILAINAIITSTCFTIADVISWKKDSTVPISDSPNRMSRICEFVFVLVRRDDSETFFCNKTVTSEYNGRKKYGFITNFIEAGNRDEPTPLNGAVFSSEFAVKLLNLYCPKDGMVYDPFMGTGTTALASRNTGRSCIGSELSMKQCEYAYNRLGGGQDMFSDITLIDTAKETE